MKLVTPRATVTVLCLCGAIGLIASPASAQDSQSRCTGIGQSWVDFYSSHDITRISDVFTNDIVWEEVPTGSLAVGLAAFAADVQGFFDDFPVSRFELVGTTGHGNRAIVEVGGPEMNLSGPLARRRRKSRS